MPTFIPTPLQTIIEPTELQTELPLTLANKFVTVSETGYYQFGIHAISDADHASLRVDNLLVGETIMTAPAAVTDLAVTAADESPVATITFTAPTKNIGGGDLTANLTHVDLLRDNVVIKSFEDVAPGTALTYTDDDEKLIGTTYTYMVVAYNADGEGDKSAMVVDNIRIVDLVEHNLTAELSAPATVQAGKTATIKATVTNWGEQAAKDFTVVITAGDEELLLETVADELAPFAKLDFDAELATTIFDEAGDRAIRLQVDYAADLKPTDNSVETTIAVVDSDVPAPTNLMAKSVADGVELNWTAPDNEPVDYTEAFDNTEAFPTFGIGGITATQHEGSMADWTLYDGNGSDVYSWGSEGIDYENRYQPSAWMAFDIAKAGFTNETGHSGAQVMLSMCPVPGEEGTATATDHWLISPELPGTEQLISFYLRAITNQYGSESFEVLASKTDSKPESFELVESFVTDEESWNEFTALLPEGTKYFAIRHTSTDVFGVMLDDVTFNYAGKMSHYNVYCQGQLIASVEDGTTTYTVAADELPEGECIFAVTAIYANGQESKPATINVTTDIRQLMTDGQPVDVYTIDGKQLRSQVTTLDGLKGIYVVNGRTVVIK